jgi:hypothetical protein
MSTLPVLLEKWRNGLAGGDVRLSVATGLHQGAAVPLNDPTYVIGSDAEADIVLKDPGIEARHVLVRRTGKRIDVEALGGDVRVGSHQVLQGRGYRSSLPVELAIGDALVQISAPIEPESQMFLKRSATVAAGVFCFFTVFVAVAANALMNTPSSTKPVDAGLAANDAALTAALGKVNSAVAQDKLATQLNEAGISGVTLALEKDRLVATGAVPKEKSEAWTNLQAWFDQTYGDKVVLASNVAVNGVEAPPRLALQAVWFGPRPYVLAGDGTRYHEGAYIENGWTINKIGDKALLLSKDGATIALNYR